ncbi:extracellular heme-binding protein [Rhodococcus sp. MTM3W5.2]|uniref:GlcG/HbpS family heme-binding protein n=1 Tax=Rhodococcus sp. MTM3W5.2 TaxID=1805827 RepID=UPI000979149C|nr:heme-binding protein [Rhodococcus sp. MTM3W5.2]AQA24668.1 extracellular heme-binding protein [Rhodococcus sp. MTM3W5.2]
MNLSRRLPKALAVTVPLAAVLATAACGSGIDEKAASAAPVTTAAVAAPAEGDQAAKGTATANRLTVGTAGAAAQAALAKCQADGLGFVTVAVVDRNGNVQAMLRGDNAAQHTVEAARQKGYTAAAFGANTSDLAGRAKGDGATVADIDGTLFLPGGVSVKAGNASIAGIGVGGAPDGMADQACAAAGLEAIAGSLR